MKLSKAQRELLEEIVTKGRAFCVVSYPPARKLIEYGLATSREGKFGTHWIEPTGSARDALMSR